MSQRFPWISEPILSRLLQTFGTRVEHIIGSANNMTGLGPDFGCVAAALLIVTRFSRKLGLSSKLGTLIAVGTSICGATAIVAIAPAIAGRDDEVSYSVACMSVFRTVGDLGESAFGFMQPKQWASLISYTKKAAEVCLAVAMASVGLGTSINALRSIGIKPMAVGLLSALLVGGVSASLITLLY